MALGEEIFSNDPAGPYTYEGAELEAFDGPATDE